MSVISDCFATLGFGDAASGRRLRFPEVAPAFVALHVLMCGDTGGSRMHVDGHAALCKDLPEPTAAWGHGD